MTLRAWNQDVAMARIRAFDGMSGALLPMLHALQEEFGYIDDACVALLADELNISKAEVVGVIHFYHDFRHAPPGAHVLKVCRAEACQSMGCDALIDHVSSRLGVELGGTTADRAFTFESVFCLGNCALSPAVMLDDNLYGRVSAERADQLIAEARAGI